MPELEVAVATRRGYAKSEETRSSIVGAALGEFGAHGFAGATTRRIATAAGVTLPAITYHFGGKEGLYLACAEHIVERYRERIAELAAAETIAPDGSGGPECCRQDLKRALHIVLRIFIRTEAAQARADFVTREMRDRGPAFQILYDRLWQPGVQFAARLVAGAKGRPRPNDTDKTEALMLISSLVAFNTGREVSLQVLGRTRFDEPAMRRLDRTIDRFVDGITRG